MHYREIDEQGSSKFLDLKKTNDTTWELGFWQDSPEPGYKSIGRIEQLKNLFSIIYHTKKGDYAFALEGFATLDYAIDALIHVALREGIVEHSFEIIDIGL